MEFVRSENLPSNGGSLPLLPTPRGIDPNRDLNEAIAEERREMDIQRYRYWTPNNVREQPKSMTPLNRDSKAAIIDSIASSYTSIQRGRGSSSSQHQQQQQTSTAKSLEVPSERAQSDQFDTNQRQQYLIHEQRPYYQTNRVSPMVQKIQNFDEIQRKIVNGTVSTSTTGTSHAWRNATKNSIEQQRRYRTKHHHLYARGKRPRARSPRDCKVSEWGAWSACSRSCGVGETQRTRRVATKPRRGGRACPPLKETKWCGSVSPCPEGGSGALDAYRW